jgi:hypothetical protein
MAVGVGDMDCGTPQRGEGERDQDLNASAALAVVLQSALRSMLLF